MPFVNYAVDNYRTELETAETLAKAIAQCHWAKVCAAVT
jgi:hypothetical protein